MSFLMDTDVLSDASNGSRYAEQRSLFAERLALGQSV